MIEDKALDDKDTLEKHGIKDGDRLYFKDLGHQIGYRTVSNIMYSKICCNVTHVGILGRVHWTFCCVFTLLPAAFTGVWPWSSRQADGTSCTVSVNGLYNQLPQTSFPMDGSANHTMPSYN